MWVLKLQTLDTLFFCSLIIYDFASFSLEILDPLTFSGLVFLNAKAYYQFAQNMSFFLGIKFLLAIAFLILIRGGSPRYRYDYLTKLGWLKFLGFVIVVFFASLFVFFTF